MNATPMFPNTPRIRRAGVAGNSRNISPLRYPGGKRWLAKPIEAVLAHNGLRPEIFVEPFCGGASVSLHLLEGNHVGRVILADKDPLVASFWRVMATDAKWLAAQIERTVPTLELWDTLKHGEHRSHRERAYACLVLNRTSFSGILAKEAGPLGGRAQTSAYTIDCRFNAENLARRVRQVADIVRRRMEVVRCDWQAAIQRAQHQLGAKTGTGLDRRLFAYLDPPFWHKANRLYNHWFEKADHVRLRDYLVAHDQVFPWLLSYDDAQAVSELYSNINGHRKYVNLAYFTSNQKSAVSELIISSVDIDLPPEGRLP